MLSPGTWSGRERSSHTGQQQCRGQGSPFSFFLRLRCGGRVRAWFKANRAFFVTPPPPSSRMFLHVPSPFERARTHFSIAGIAFPHEFGNPPRPRRGRRGRMRPHSCARPLRATRIPLQGHVRAASRGALRPARRRGYGKAIIRHLAQKALDEGCGRFDWSVLDWNQPAIDFYEGLGAEVLPDWRICRLSGEALLRAAGR